LLSELTRFIPKARRGELRQAIDWLAATGHIRDEIVHNPKGGRPGERLSLLYAPAELLEATEAARHFFSVALSPEQYVELQQLAFDQRLTMGDLVRRAVQAELDRSLLA
jgi:hypothetical protein